jgi:hypothetical protein
MADSENTMGGSKTFHNCLSPADKQYTTQPKSPAETNLPASLAVGSGQGPKPGPFDTWRGLSPSGINEEPPRGDLLTGNLVYTDLRLIAFSQLEPQST